MEKDCNYYMDSYLMLDKGSLVPFKTAIHLMGCRKCRNEVKTMIKAERLISSPLKQHESLTFFKKPVTILQWVIGGVIMIAALCIFGVYTKSIKDTLTEILFNSTLAFVIIAYTALFIGTNLDFFVKKIETKQQQI